MTYAANTDVSVERSRAELERTLARYGAGAFGYMTEPGRAVVNDDRRATGWLLALLILAGVLFAAFIWALAEASGHPTMHSASADSIPPISVPAIIPPATIAEVVVAATANMPAVRVDPPETQPPFDPVAYVNSLDYGWTDDGPAMEAFRIVALSRGWSDATIQHWTPWAWDVIMKESGGCPNATGGDLFVPGTCNQYTRHGNAEDSGMGQATSSLWGSNGVLCLYEGICSQWQIISSPWTSMVAVVATLEHLGSAPWCYDTRSRGYHDCTLIGRKEKPLP